MPTASVVRPGLAGWFTESIFDRKPSEYVKSLSPDRFSETPWNWKDARREAAHVYETYYGV